MSKDAYDAPRDFQVSLVLGGGNALGAYHLGVCESLLGASLAPAWYLGASIGAISGAILVGNPPDRRLERLRRFWSLATQPGVGFAALSEWLSREARAWVNNDHALNALAFGRPGLFRSRVSGVSPSRSRLSGWGLRDQRPLAETLRQLIDFGRLNGAREKLSIITINIESGEEVWFDNWKDEIGPEHLMAATALAPLFPPVEIEGRLLCDAGLGNNLPIDRLFREAPADEDLLCIAVDLYHAAHGRPATLDETVARVQDLMFALQSQRAVEALSREQALVRRLEPHGRSAILCHLAYQAPDHQRALKALDFSRASLDERISQGRSDMERMLDRLTEAPRTEPLAYLGPDPS
jgi:NTE family protein